MMVESEAGFAQRVLIPGEALLGGLDRDEIAQVADPPMTMPDQVPDAARRPGAVVRYDAVGGEILGRPVEEDDRRAHLHLMEQVTAVVPCPDDDEAVDPPQQ